MLDCFCLEAIANALVSISNENPDKIGTSYAMVHIKSHYLPVTTYNYKIAAMTLSLCRLNVIYN